jgi:hypothetical protein
MKKSIALGFALSVLAASSAFASPQASVAQPVVLEPIYVHATALDAKVADKDSVQPFAGKSFSTVIVAENRKDFGSQYQRY